MLIYGREIEREIATGDEKMVSWWGLLGMETGYCTCYVLFSELRWSHR